MIELGPFAVSPHGTLSVRDAARPPAIGFTWRERPCQAMLDADGLRLHAKAGRIPSTAEPGADRGQVFGALAAVPPTLPTGWKLRLTADHRLAVETVAPAARTATALVAQLVGFALALDPYLDKLDAAGAGTLKT